MKFKVLLYDNLKKHYFKKLTIEAKTLFDAKKIADICFKQWETKKKDYTIILKEVKKNDSKNSSRDSQ